MNKSDLWIFKYQPQLFDDMILSDDCRDQLQPVLEGQQNAALIGPPGVGKGTFTNIYLKHHDASALIINGSKETGIDVMREKVDRFASTLGFSNKIKVVVLNECERISKPAQDSLLALIEDVHSITRFILMANKQHTIIPELFSRCPEIQITNPPAPMIFNHCMKILKKEKIKVDKQVLVNIVKHCYPDIRKTIGIVQRSINKGKLETCSFKDSKVVNQMILDAMKEQDINGVREVLKSNFVDYAALYEFLFDNVGEFQSAGDAILCIGEAMRWDYTVASKEINFMTMVVDMLKRNIL